MIKFVFGLLLVLAAIWTPFYVWTYLPEEWRHLWYAFPLFITTTTVSFVTGTMGIGCIVEAINA